jgi:hypothetical protein
MCVCLGGRLLLVFSAAFHRDTEEGKQTNELGFSTNFLSFTNFLNNLLVVVF